MKFYVGLHQPGDAKHFDRAFISINRMRDRKGRLPCKDWILDSGAFSEIERNGCYRHSPAAYAAEINRLAAINEGLAAAVSQDWMCEQFILQRTGLTVADHQRLTIQRYDALLPLVRITYLLPVLQGYTPASYVDHVRQYGDRLCEGAYVGVGSLCKRNGKPFRVEDVLLAIKRYRPDLQLHGFGLKITALGSGVVRSCLVTADSMAWSFAARYEGRNANNWQEALRFAKRVDTMPVQLGLQLS